MDLFHKYITTVFIIKICFIILVIVNLYYKIKGEEKSKKSQNVSYWKERFEFIFKLLMSALLIYIFNPRHSRQHLIDKETTILFYLFGFVLIISSKWYEFIITSGWYKKYIKK